MIRTRRRFLGQAGLATGGVLLGDHSWGEEQVEEETTTISILHTTDLHGHVLPTSDYDGNGDLGGLARCATQIRKWRAENPNSLVVDIGDVYQGTPVGWMTRGRLMIDLFNKIGYDAWVLGNHEFDWGPEVVIDAATRSAMPVMTANLELEGKKAGMIAEATNPYSRIQPHVIKEMDGIRVGLIGMITPGLPYWLPGSLRKGFQAISPVEILKEQVAHLKDEHEVDAIVVCGHMGLTTNDDFANPVQEMLKGEHGVDVYIAGHTHRRMESVDHAGVLYTQANYFGIHCGRVQLTFDRETRRLVSKSAEVVLMDSKVAGDPVVLEASAKDLGEAQLYLDREIGETKGVILSKQPSAGSGSPLQKLLSAAFEWHAIQTGIEIDGVFHGTFGSGDLKEGPKTVADAWKMVPYDNRMVVLSLNREELIGILNESLEVYSDRALDGFEVGLTKNEAPKGERRGGRFVTSLRSLRKAEAGRDEKFTILFNSYDAQSGGKRLMRLRALAERQKETRTLLPLSSREALIEYFLAKKTVDAAEFAEG